MLTSTEIMKIESLQDRQAKVRKVAFNVLNKYLKLKGHLITISILSSRVINGERLNNSEIQRIVDIAKEVDHAIPENRQQFVLVTLQQKLVFRHFNQFGQELK